jgi:replicative DNA helicase
MSESVKKKTINVLTKFSAKQVAEQNQDYVDKRRKGLIKSLKTKFPRLDKSLMGGIELDTILAVSALSGAGKSTIAKCIMDSFIELNPDTKFNMYNFNFEMIAHQQAARSIVTSANMSLRKLYSVDEPLTDAEYKGLMAHYEQLKQRDNVFFIETPGTAKQICDSLRHYYLTECKTKGKVMVYVIDHALLTKGKDGDKEKEKIDNLMLGLVEVKKQIASDGGHSVGIVLSQMNRDIRKIERIKVPEQHRPQTSDLFGASSIEQCADYIIFSHLPAKLNLPERKYTEQGFPTKMKVGDRVIQIPYFELVKQRSGEAGMTIPMWNKLDRFDFDEMDRDDFQRLHRQFIETKECIYEEQKSIF